MKRLLVIATALEKTNLTIKLNAFASASTYLMKLLRLVLAIATISTFLMKLMLAFAFATMSTYLMILLRLVFAIATMSTYMLKLLLVLAFATKSTYLMKRMLVLLAIATMSTILILISVMVNAIATKTLSTYSILVKVMVLAIAMSLHMILTTTLFQIVGVLTKLPMILMTSAGATIKIPLSQILILAAATMSGKPHKLVILAIASLVRDRIPIRGAFAIPVLISLVGTVHDHEESCQ
jgi:hypothetical protein